MASLLSLFLNVVRENSLLMNVEFGKGLADWKYFFPTCESLKMVRLRRKNLQKVTHENLMFMESLMLFDMWLILKLRWLMGRIYETLVPLVKIALIMSIGVLLTLLVKKDSNLAQITVAKSDLLLDGFSKTDGKSITSVEMCNNLVHQYSKDRMLPDFASEASGAMVIGTPGTTTYGEPELRRLKLFGLTVWTAGYYTPRKVIQSWTEAGECWAFDGSQGKIEIEMAYEILIEKVSLEHIPASAALTGKIDSAPKSFRVWGKVADEYVVIGAFAYDDKGMYSQTFEVKNAEMKAIPLKIVMLEILSNYGHPNYTCIYRFRIHGKVYSSSTETEQNKIY